MKTSQRSLLPIFVASAKIVQTERNETCFDCRGAANLLQSYNLAQAMSRFEFSFFSIELYYNNKNKFNI